MTSPATPAVAGCSRTGRRRTLAALAAVTARLATTAAQAAISPGTWYTITSRHSGLALDIEGASTATGAVLIQLHATGATNQQFRFVHSGGGYYRIQARHSNQVPDVYEWERIRMARPGRQLTPR